MSEEKINYQAMLDELKADQQREAGKDRAALKPVYNEIAGNAELRNQLITQASQYSYPGVSNDENKTPSENRIRALRGDASVSPASSNEYRMFVAVAIQGGMNFEQTSEALARTNPDVERLANIIGNVAVERAAAQARAQGAVSMEKAPVDLCRDIPNAPSMHQAKLDCYANGKPSNGR